MRDLKDFNNEIEARKHFGEKPFEKDLKEKIIEILENMPMNMTKDVEAAIIKNKVLQIAIKNPPRIANQILKLFSQQKQEIVEENKRLKLIASKYAQAISLMADGVPYDKLPKRLQ